MYNTSCTGPYKACTKARWCVTYSDLQFLHDEVADSIFDGGIDVEEEELTYGPSIYKVNETLGCGITCFRGF